MADRDLGRLLLRIARDSIGAQFGAQPGHVDLPINGAHARLEEPGATFVTLKLDDALRGCIGSLEALRALRLDVARNAVHAAFSDPRFAPLRPAEFEVIDIEVSLLGATTPLTFASEDDLLAQLVPGQDGLVLQHGRNRGTFLPQVWDALPDRRDFLRELKGKAGLRADFWSAHIEVARYSVAKWTERELTAADGGDPYRAGAPTRPEPTKVT